MSAPQTINSSYLADLIKINEQALASFKERTIKTDGLRQNDGMLEWLYCSNVEFFAEKQLDDLRKYHAFLVAKEQAEHRAERLSQSNSAIGLNRHE